MDACRLYVPVLAVSHADSCKLTVIAETPPGVVVVETLINGELQGLEATVALESVFCLLEQEPCEGLLCNLVLEEGEREMWERWERGERRREEGGGRKGERGWSWRVKTERKSP